MTPVAKIDLARVMLARGDTYKAINKALRARFGTGVATDTLTDLRQAMLSGPMAQHAVHAAQTDAVGRSPAMRGILLLPDGTWEYC